MPADVLLAYLHPNDVSASFHQSLLGLLGWDLTHDHRLGPWANVRCATGGIPEGRNQVAAQMLAEPVEWLFMIDADMGFAPDTLDRLLAVADPVHRPVVGGLCFAHREQHGDGLNGFRCEARPTIYDWVEHPDGHRRFTGVAHYPVNSLMRAGATGAACLLIHRTAIEAIRDLHGPAWFDRLRGSDGSLLGEDISFCVRLGAVGMPLYIHTGIKTNHHKQLWVGESDFWAQFRPEPASDPVDVIVPCLHRPRNVGRLMRSLRASTGLATAWWVCEDGDQEQADEVRAHGGVVLTRSGTFAEKVNYAYTQTSRRRFFITGDDVVFRPGWLDHCQHVADRYDAKVIGTNDLGNPRVMAGEHATHMMIDRGYVDTVGASWDGPGIVCHEYGHWYVDDEIVTAAKQRGVWQMALGAIVEHLHPVWGKADDDEVYRKGQRQADRDRRKFEQRVKQYA